MSTPPPEPQRPGARPGVAYLVGAGPGDPGLMTTRSLELIATADAILYDRLIPAGALEGARDDAELRYVGKEPGAPAMEQDEINTLLVNPTDMQKLGVKDGDQVRVWNEQGNVTVRCKSAKE